MSRTNYAKRGGAIRFGKRLRQLRKAGKLTLREVAAAADMDQAILSKVELGQRVPTEEQTKHLAKVFTVNERDMQAQRIAEKFRQDNEGRERVARDAICILAEEAGAFGSKSGASGR